TLLLGSFLLASYLFYHSSDRIKFQSRPAWIEKLSKKPKQLRTIAMGIFLIGLLASLLLHGLGSGIFGWIVYMMGMLCLVVLLHPYRQLKGNHMIVFFLISGVLELLYTYLKHV